jgi:hypothetical protein
MSITFLLAFEWSGKVLKRQGVEGFMSAVQDMGICKGRLENLEKSG